MQMLTTFDDISEEVLHLDRDGIVAALRSFTWLRMDFSPEYLESCPIEKLQHLLAAAIWRGLTREGEKGRKVAVAATA